MRVLWQFRLLAAALVMAAGMTAQAQSANQYFTGDGGKDIRLAVLEPSGKGLSEKDRWILSHVQGSITGDFNKFSGMTIIDRQNLEKVMSEWEEHTSGKYSDADYVRIGNLTNASHILTGSISETPNYFIIEFSVTDLESGERKASYPPKQASIVELENLSVVKAASADLLRQLGVELTDAGIAELKRVEDAAKLQAGAMLARGIAAKNQGSEVAALNYFLQAAALDSTLLEAANRSSVLSVDISSGNIGDDTRNEIQWRKDWMARLRETETFFHNRIKNSDPPYTLFYSTDIERGEINYEKETTTFSFLVNLNTNEVWFHAIQEAVQAVCDGINATEKKDIWLLSDWPRKGVSSESKTSPFAVKQRYSFSAAFELVNERGLVIGRQTVTLETFFRFYTNRDVIMVEYPKDIFQKVTFNGVNANDISGVLTIRVAAINGANPDNARIQITALSSPSETSRLSRGYEDRLEDEKMEKAAKLKRERESTAFGFGVGLCYSFAMSGMNPVYKDGIGFNTTIDWYKDYISFLRFGIDVGVGFFGVDSGAFKQKYPDLDVDDVNGSYLKANVFMKLQPVNAVFLSGGVGLWWGGVSKTEGRESVFAPVFPIGGGFKINTVDVFGFIIEGQYSILSLQDRTGNYWSIRIMVGI